MRMAAWNDAHKRAGAARCGAYRQYLVRGAGTAISLQLADNDIKKSHASKRAMARAYLMTGIFSYLSSPRIIGA